MESFKKIVTEFDANRDMPNRRVIETPVGQVIAERTDPYGFVYLHREKGQMPERLRGAYSSFEKAQRAADSYFRDIVDVQPGVTKGFVKPKKEKKEETKVL